MDKEELNKIINYINDRIRFDSNGDEEGIQDLRERGQDDYVSLNSVGETFVKLIYDINEMINHNEDLIDYSQGLTELRMKAIVESLPEDTKNSIKRKFDEAEDDLFREEQEEENNNNTNKGEDVNE